jgi:hypothetical protein
MRTQYRGQMDGRLDEFIFYVTLLSACCTVNRPACE